MEKQVESWIIIQISQVEKKKKKQLLRLLLLFVVDRLFTHSVWFVECLVVCATTQQEKRRRTWMPKGCYTQQVGKSLFLLAGTPKTTSHPPWVDQRSITPDILCCVHHKFSSVHLFISRYKKTNIRKWKQIKQKSPSLSECQFHVFTRTISFSLWFFIICINANDEMCWMVFGCNWIGNWMFWIRLWKRWIDWVRQVFLVPLKLFILYGLRGYDLRDTKSQCRLSLCIYVKSEMVAKAAGLSLKIHFGG